MIPVMCDGRLSEKGQNRRELCWNAMVETVDKNGDGIMGFKEFEVALFTMNFSQIFRCMHELNPKLDPNNDGIIAKARLYKVCHSHVGRVGNIDMLLTK